MGITEKWRALGEAIKHTFSRETEFQREERRKTVEIRLKKAFDNYYNEATQVYDPALERVVIERFGKRENVAIFHRKKVEAPLTNPFDTFHPMLTQVLTPEGKEPEAPIHDHAVEDRRERGRKPAIVRTFPPSLVRTSEGIMENRRVEMIFFDNLLEAAIADPNFQVNLRTSEIAPETIKKWVENLVKLEHGIVVHNVQKRHAL